MLVNYRLAAQIERLLESGALTGYDVLVIDNGSEPDYVDMLQQRFGIQVLLLRKNLGFAGAINEAAVQFELYCDVLLLNPDVMLPTGAISSLVDFRRRANLTGVSPLLVSPTGELQVGTAGGPVSVAAYFGYFLFVSQVWTSFRGLFFTRRQLRLDLKPSWLCMACLMLSGEALREFGALPVHEFMYTEDVEWGVEASAAGARFAIDKSLAVVHEQGAAGGGAAWRGATERLLLRKAKKRYAKLGVYAMRIGLLTRELLGRQIR